MESVDWVYCFYLQTQHLKTNPYKAEPTEEYFIKVNGVNGDRSVTKGIHCRRSSKFEITESVLKINFMEN